MPSPATKNDIANLKAQINVLRSVLGTFISLAATSSVAPINQAEATKLLNTLGGK